MANDPNTFSYSSSSVMSYSNDGRGEPKYFQATKSTKKAPGGVTKQLFVEIHFLNCVLGFISCNLPQKVGLLSNRRVCDNTSSNTRA